MTGLADILAARHRKGVDLRVGAVVAGGAANHVNVDMGGATVVDIPHLATYTPTVGDRVVVLIGSDGAAIVIGNIAGTETP